MELKNEFGLALNDIISLVSEKIVNRNLKSLFHLSIYIFMKTIFRR